MRILTLYSAREIGQCAAEAHIIARKTVLLFSDSCLTVVAEFCPLALSEKVMM